VAVELLRRRCEAVKKAGVKPEEGLVLLFMDVGGRFGGWIKEDIPSM